MFTVNFSTDNAAFGQCDDECIRNIERGVEIANTLERIKGEVLNGRTYGSVIDINGNKVGEWKLD